MRVTPGCDILRTGEQGADEPPIVAVVGPTASGKTDVGVEIAERIGGEIVSADSVAVYRGFDIGAAKPDCEQRARVRFHLIDVANADEDFNAARFKELALAAITDIRRRGRRVVLVGGTGFYVRVVLDDFGLTRTGAAPELRARLEAEADAGGTSVLHDRLAALDPDAAARIHPNDRVRIIRALEVVIGTGEPISVLQARDAATRRALSARRYGLDMPRAELDERIDRRVQAMMARGLLAEVADLLGRGVSPGSRPMTSLGYKELVRHLRGELSLDEAVCLIARNTRRFARRQLTWFRADPLIRWIDVRGRTARDVCQAILSDEAVTTNGAGMPGV